MAPIDASQPLAQPAAEPVSEPLQLLGHTFTPGSRHIISQNLPDSATHQTSVVIVHGTQPGPTLCITAALHGDEINGVEITRQLMESLDPGSLRGSVVAIPVINLDGYLNRQRYMADHCDLNRCFPGRDDGSYSEQVAHALLTEIVLHCGALIDLHSGTTGRENLPQLRADLTITNVADFLSGFDSLAILQSKAPHGSLRGAASSMGIPAIVAEIGGSSAYDPDMVQLGIAAIHDLLRSMKMTTTIPVPHPPHHTYLGSGWIRAAMDGILVNKVSLGKAVLANEVIAEIINPLTSVVIQVKAPFACTILGRVHNQVVARGYDIFQVGVEH